MVAANAGVPMNTTRMVSAPALRARSPPGGARGQRYLVVAQRLDAGHRVAALEHGDAVEVVQLVLQAAAEEIVAFDLPLLAVEVEITHARKRRARDGNRDAGAQTAGARWEP